MQILVYSVELHFQSEQHIWLPQAKLLAETHGLIVFTEACEMKADL